MLTSSLTCPICKSVSHHSPSVNGGQLYVAEETREANEFYDTAVPYECTACKARFYVDEDSLKKNTPT
jgi:hypothetical protein